MSWYQKTDNPTVHSKPKLVAEEINNIITLTFTISDMTSKEDFDIITQSLLKVRGVVKVRQYNGFKKLSVSYNPYITRVEYIAFEISKLGYHYVQRA